MFPPHSKVSVNLASIYGIKLASPALVTATKLKDPSWDPEKRLGMSFILKIEGDVIALPSKKTFGCNL